MAGNGKTFDKSSMLCARGSRGRVVTTGRLAAIDTGPFDCAQDDAPGGLLYQRVFLGLLPVMPRFSFTKAAIHFPVYFLT